VAQTLTSQGFKNAYALKGGLDAWAAAGYPLQTKKTSGKR